MHIDFHHFLIGVRRGLHIFQHDERADEEGDDDDQGDDGPEHFGGVVVRDLGGEFVVRFAPVAEDDPEDHGFDDDEDGDADAEHDEEEHADVVALVGDGGRERDLGQCALGEGEQAEQRAQRDQPDT